MCVQGLPVPLRALGLAASTLLFSAFLALTPYGIHADVTENGSPQNFPGVYLVRCEAHALTIEPGSTALDFVNQMATAAGMSAGELVTTTLGIAAVGSGAILATQQGQNWGMTAGEALSNVVEAADYPDYDSLTTEQKNLWGTKENYDAAKYVSLMNGLGFGTEYERFEQVQGSGGGNFEFEDDAQDRLNQFFRIGSLWKSRLGVMYGDIKGLISNMEVINSFPAVPAGSGVLVFDGSQEEQWPSTLPDQVNVGFSDELRTVGIDGRNNVTKNYYKLSTQEYFLIFAYPNGTWINVIGGAFSEETFNWGLSYSDTPPATNSAANHLTNYGGIYATNINLSVGVATKAWDMSVPYNYVETSISQTAYNKAMQIILSKGVESGTTGEADSIVDYPDGDVSNNQRIYYPENGVTPETTWNQFTTPQTPVRENETPFNPGNQTQTPQWQTDTEENVLPIMDLPFDKLFPFCLLYDVPLLLEKVLGATSGGVSAQDANRYNVIKLEIPEMTGIGFSGFEFELDLQPLEDLLDLVRPVLQMFLIVVLLAASIEFFKQIITG